MRAGSRSLLVFVLSCLVSATFGIAADAPAKATAPAAAKPASAPEIAWQEFAPPAFRRAIAEDRLVLLVLEMPWSADCAKARAEVWNDPAVLAMVRRGYVPVRARADLRPELARRYPAEGWPAVSLLLPDGTPVYLQSKDVPDPRRITSGFLPADRMTKLLESGLGYYKTDRNAVVQLATKREESTEKTSRPEAGPIDEAAVWGIATQLRASFDPERRYFGGAPRLPRFELIELISALAAEQEDPWRVLGTASLDTLASKLTDPADGALRRMATGLDWEDPQPEKLLDRNARFLDLLTLAWRQSGSATYRDRARKVATFIANELSRKDGFFNYTLAPALPDDVVISGPNGIAAASLIRAGAALDEPAFVERGLRAATELKQQRWRPGRLVPRAVVGGEAVSPGNLEDQAEVAWAFLAAYEATGKKEWLDATRDLVVTTLANLRGVGTSALADTIPQPGAPRPLRRPLYSLNANAEFVRILVRLHYLIDEHGFSRAARDILGAFGKSYTNVPLWIPNFGLAAYEYFFPPITVAVFGPASDPNGNLLRRAAMGAAHPFVIVRTLDTTTDPEKVKQLGFPIASDDAAVAHHGGLASLPERDPAALKGLMAGLREKYQVQQKSREKMAVKPEDRVPANAGQPKAPVRGSATPAKPAAPAPVPPPATAPKKTP